MRNLLLAVFSAALAHTAFAGVACVGSDLELQAAMQQIALDPGGDYTIELQQHDYNADAAFATLPPGFAIGSLELLGGYTASCAGRVISPWNTSLTHSASYVQLPVSRALTIEGVAVTGHLIVQTYGSGAVADVTLRSDIFAANANTHANLLNVQVGDGGQPGFNLRFEQNLVAGQTLGNPGFDVMINIDGQGGASTQVEADNNTIADNAGIGIAVAYVRDVRFDNNVVWNNSGDGIHLYSVTDAPVLIDNQLQAANLYGGAIEAGTSNANPLFVGGGNYHLQNASPAINSANSNVPGGIPGTDLDGNARQVGTLDRGVYESAINNSSVLTVTTNADSGTGSLREAITSANNVSGPATIVFDMPPPASGCLVVILLKSELPDITDSVTIDGYSQPGSAPNTALAGTNANICVGLAGLGNRTWAFHVPNGAGNVQLDVSGLAFSGFNDAAIKFNGGSGHQVWGNHFGPGLPGTEGALGWIGSFRDVGVIAGTSGVLIGGFSAERRNLLGSASGDAVFVNSASNTSIINNLIGPDRGGVYASGTANAGGIYVLGGDVTVISNVISGNSQNALTLSASANSFIFGNRIGVPAFVFCILGSCQDSLPNGGAGVLVLDGSSSDAVDNNTIAFNTAGGVKLLSTNLGTPQQIRISANAIHDNGNGSIAASGIDLSPLDGAVNPNDNDVTGGAGVPNGSQNYPVLGVATGRTTAGTVAGTLASRNGTYTIELFASKTCAASGYGEGETFIGSVPVTIANATLGFNGSANFSASVSLDAGTFVKYPVITATARDSGGNTSEFSQCVVYDYIFGNGFEAN